MRIEMMKKGDKVINVTEQFIVIKRKGGEVDLIPYRKLKERIEIDLKSPVTIGYEVETVSIEMENGVTITKF